MSGSPADPSASEFDPLLGRVVGGKFVIERRLGAGAMGAVYRATQTGLERTVAIKVMHGEIASDPTYAARFHREAKAVSRLDHPNLIRVLDYGQDPDGLLYIAMEFLDGRDLFSAIEDEWPLSHERMVDVLSQALSALTEAHDAGVLHRDLKPENIMLLRKKGEDGTPIDTVKVCDFGIAKVAEEPEAEPGKPSSGGGGRKLTTAGLIVGTPGYMSPEQARSEPCDARSDVYAVGVILYQLLTRRLPYEGNTPLDVVVKALHDPLPPPDSHGPTAAPGLEPVCMKAMNKRPADRYQSAREMRTALRAAPLIERKTVFSSSSEDRPSIVNAPTQLELVEASAATGTRAVPAAAHVSRFWRAGGMLAGLAVAGFAVFSLANAHTSPPSAMTVAPPSVSAVRALPMPTETATPSAAPTSVAIPTPPIADVPAAPASSHALGHRTHEAKEAPLTPPPMPVTPDTPLHVAAAPPVPPAPPIPLPTEAPAAPAPAAPSPPVVAAPAPPAPPTFNVATARVEIGQARTNNAAATSSAIGRAIAPLAAKLTACYRASLARATTASEVAATLHLESDDQGYVTSAHVVGSAPADAARCIEGVATRNVKIDVDTGTINADISLRFEPQ